MSDRVQIRQFIEELDFFSGLDRKLLDKTAQAALLRTYPAGEAVVRQGEVGLGLYAILHGRVKVEREQGGVSRHLAELGANQVFAEISMVDNKPRSATVTTLEETECMLLTRDSFLKLVKSYPELALRLAKVLAERLRTADEKLAAHESAGVPPQPAAGPSASTQSSSAETGPANGDSSGFEKSRVQASMLDTFQRLYAVKALVRFSVAVLGCPVEGVGPQAQSQIRVGETKAILLPSADRVELDIVARERGAFTLHVFSPGGDLPVCFGPLPIDPLDCFRLCLAGGAASLLNADTAFAPSTDRA